MDTSPHSPPQSSRNAPTTASRTGRDPARAAAYAHLADIASRLPDLDPKPLDDRHLSPRDAAFAHAIVGAGLQRWLTLAYLLGGFLSKPFPDLEPALRGALIGGSAQLLLLDKVPTHAAINETVEWAKTVIRPGAGAMVNAVLRRVAGLLAPAPTPTPAGPRPAWTGRRDELLLTDGSARRLTAEVLPEDPMQRLSVLTSHPPALTAAWSARYGPDAARPLLLHSLATPPTVLYIAAATAPLPPGLEPHASPAHRVSSAARADLQTLLAQRTDLWVQDSGSSIAVAAAADLRPGLVVDLCAGQGTKTRQLAHTFPAARIIATDTDADRFATLRRVFGGHPRVEVVSPGDVTGRCAGRADLVLLDVPCSNTGVLARRIEAKYRWSPRMLERMARLQRDIITAGVALLAPVGRLLYSTCSLEPEENEQQADWTTERMNLRLITSRLSLPEGVPGDPPGRYRDGSFHALFIRGA